MAYLEFSGISLIIALFGSILTNGSISSIRKFLMFSLLKIIFFFFIEIHSGLIVIFLEKSIFSSA
jgi:hypothetical protein